MIGAEPGALARLHARAFDGRGRGWSAGEFAELLASPLTCLCARPHGFALARVVVDEAELLTLATDPDHRRQGIAAAILSALEDAVTLRGARRLFLEVAADNAAARALYAKAGYLETGRRSGYYTHAAGPPVDALQMEKVLSGG
jgi:ribosomal-protein-alanine N-acetyltransferase